jgi:hypothetical protein|tara:strand:- start:976 stop:1260 length:285 start_codon:yes stop_codon:yes gene_type:complete
MTTKAIRTVLPIAPNAYDQNFANQLARNLDRVIDEQRNPVLNIQNVPSDGVANILEVGDLFEAGGFLKIVRQNDKFTGSNSATGSIGTVTVSTP